MNAFNTIIFQLLLQVHCLMLASSSSTFRTFTLQNVQEFRIQNSGELNANGNYYSVPNLGLSLKQKQYATQAANLLTVPDKAEFVQAWKRQGDTFFLHLLKNKDLMIWQIADCPLVYCKEIVYQAIVPGNTLPNWRDPSTPTILFSQTISSDIMNSLYHDQQKSDRLENTMQHSSEKLIDYYSATEIKNRNIRSMNKTISDQEHELNLLREYVANSVNHTTAMENQIRLNDIEMNKMRSRLRFMKEKVHKRLEQVVNKCQLNLTVRTDINDEPVPRNEQNLSMIPYSPELFITHNVSSDENTCALRQQLLKNIEINGLHGNNINLTSILSFYFETLKLLNISLPLESYCTNYDNCSMRQNHQQSLDTDTMNDYSVWSMIKYCIVALGTTIIICSGFGIYRCYYQNKEREIAQLWKSHAHAINQPIISENHDGDIVKQNDKPIDQISNMKKLIPAWNSEKFDNLVKNSVVIQDALMDDIVEVMQTEGQNKEKQNDENTESLVLEGDENVTNLCD